MSHHPHQHQHQHRHGHHCRKAQVSVTQLPVGSPSCSQGGALIQSSCPLSRAVVCNGAPGARVTVTQLPVGSSSCPAGGALIQSTVPNSSAIVCNGAPGLPGPPGGCGPAPTLSQIVYVNKGGNDATGNGGLCSPYLTIARAFASITDASADKVYDIQVGPGTYNDNFQTKPWIAVVGVPATSAFKGPTTIDAPSVTLDPVAWAGPMFDVGWFSHISFQDNFPPLPYTFDFTAVDGGGNGNAQLTFFDCLFSVGVNLIGSGSGNVNNMTMDNCLSYGGASVTNCQFLFTVGGTVFQGGTLTLNSTVQLTTWFADGGGFAPFAGGSLGTINVNGPGGSAGARAQLIGCAVDANVFLNGPNANWTATIEGIPPTISSTNNAVNSINTFTLTTAQLNTPSFYTAIPQGFAVYCSNLSPAPSPLWRQDTLGFHWVDATGTGRV